MDGFEAHFNNEFDENITYQEFVVPTGYGGKLPEKIKCNVFILNENRAELPKEVLCCSFLINENFKGELPKKITCFNCFVKTTQDIIFPEEFLCHHFTHITLSKLNFPKNYKGFLYEGYSEVIAKNHFLMFNKLDSEKEAYFI